MKNQTKTSENFIIVTDNYRISFLTTKLFRLEKYHYLDSPTQVIINRNIDDNFFVDVNEISNGFEFITKDIKVEITSNGDVNKITFLNNMEEVTDFKTYNLKGTARTLDGVNASCPLNDGIMSKNGVAILDDSLSLIVENDTIYPRDKSIDYYYFAYQNDYLEALKVFYKLTGNVPLIPKFALGNWWSRYHAYTDKEYLNLINHFKKENIPISVSVIDMDWHYVDNYHEFRDDSLFTKEELQNKKIQNEYYDGWTGYTFNSHLFKDYKKFLNVLHQNNLKVTLNLHPNSGVRKYEAMFTNMANALNIDSKTTRIIPFDITSKDFIKAYFEIIHHPYENDGVDFWWIDWQQGVKSSMAGLDPLWALNYYHYKDNDRNDKRPLILSRFSGPGSHRYPIGFSGDTYMTWEALAFQPYFTLTSSNIGYVWWSHDIGGHMGGYKDDELYLRWLQLGVFSPINRLHSTCNEFTGKEPWKFVKSTQEIATNYLRLRKSLIPYLYSMNYQTYKNALPLVMPLYYIYKEKQAYEFKNEYLFGSELLVSPITTKTNKITKLAKVKTYLPKGKWFDIFTNKIYEGPMVLNIYRNIENIPVFAKQGAIIPLFVDNKTNNIDNNQDLKILVYSGNNQFKLYEDDGETKSYENGLFSIKEITNSLNGNQIILKISKNINALTNMNFKRNIQIVFKDVLKAKITCNVSYKKIKGSCLMIKFHDCSNDIVIKLDNCKFLTNKDFNDELIDLVSTYQMNNDKKMELFAPLLHNKNYKLIGNKNLIDPINELKKLK